MKLLQTIIISCILLSINCAHQSAVNGKKVYRGKIKLQGFYNTTAMPLVEVDMYVFDNYILEEVLKIVTRSHSVIKDGVMQENPDSASATEVLQKYILINPGEKKCIEFDTSFLQPSVLKSYPLEQKRDGFGFTDELPDVKDLADAFNFTRDTIVNGKKYTLIKNSRQKKDQQGTPIPLISIYVDQELKNFPIHLISTALDKKFGGACTRMESTDSTNNTFIVEWKYTPGLTSKDSVLINKFINIYGGRK